MIVKHRFEPSEEGVPQGGPLSPLLSNIMLHELDTELVKRGHKFMRYADNLVILCKSKRRAQRVYENISCFLENELFLKANRDKSKVCHIKEVNSLGILFTRPKVLGGFAYTLKVL